MSFLKNNLYNLILLSRLGTFIILTGSAAFVPLKNFYIPLFIIIVFIFLYKINIKDFLKKQVLLVLIFCSHLLLIFYFAVEYFISDAEHIFTAEQTVIILNLFYKTAFSYIAVSFYNTINSFTEIIATMRILRIPSLFIILFTISHRYMCVFSQKACSMMRNYHLRVYKRKKIIVLFYMIKTMMIKSYIYSLKILSAMTLRNFNSNIDFRKIR